MNKNKGIIGIGLIIAIVLGAIIIGGGAYYLGKSGTKQEVKISENILPNNPEINQNQNLPVVDNSQQVNVAKTTVPTVTTGCTPSSTPSIKVLSPNGGEVYQAGDKITVKWSSCNIPATHKFYVGLGISGEFQGAPPLIKLSDSTINDGIETFNLNNIQDSGLYILFMKDNDLPNGTTNSGSNKFTINSSKVTPVADMKLLSFKANKGEFLAETPRLNSSNVEIKVYYFPTGTGMTEPYLLGSMRPFVGSSGDTQTWSLSAYLEPYTNNKQAIMATSIYATLYIDGKEVNTINYPATGASAIYDSIYGNL